MYKDLSIIIPCRNENENLKFIIPNLTQYSEDIIIVDGNSNDGTEETCKKFNVRHILDNNLGKGMLKD